ncbi:MAG: response regulator [Gammaproteobacteria bacterium]
MSDSNVKILLVDDEVNILRALSRLLKDYPTTTATSAEEALMLAKDAEFDLVISDYRMPGMDGVSFLTEMRRLQPDSVRIILTGYADIDGLQNAINDAAVFRFINKPWCNLEVSHAVEKGLEHKRILQENQALADQVRKQQARLIEQEAILKALEEEEPGITKVNWGEDGSIILDEKDLE